MISIDIKINIDTERIAHWGPEKTNKFMIAIGEILRMKGMIECEENMRETKQLADEYQRLIEVMKVTHNELAIARGEEPPHVIEEKKVDSISAVEHRLKIIDFLKEHGQAKRSEILIATQIPAGTIGSILRTDSPDFEQVERGLWQLRTPKETKEEPCLEPLST